MRNPLKGLVWLNDLFQIFFCDRFNPGRKPYSLAASSACRTLKFQARAKIRPKPLAELLQAIASRPVEQVILPGASTNLGDVGSQTGYHTIACLVQAAQPAAILEFGTYLGVSAYTMALNTPAHCHIYTVDLPDHALPAEVPQLNLLDQQHVQKSRHRVGQAFLNTPLRHRITQIRCDSLSFRAEEHLAQADVVLVDGGHSAPIVAKDTENAFRILSPKGVIIWDDYFHLYPEVVRFLDRLADQYPLQAIAGTNLVLHIAAPIANQ